MAKTTIATEDNNKFCPIHQKPKKYSRKQKIWYCSDCLYGSFLTHQAQREAVKRYRQSAKGKKAEKRYEQSTVGKEARERYLKSDKYKQRRREYNERLKESLRIARLAGLERASAEKEVEVQRTETFAPLVQDIREYIDVFGHLPIPTEVQTWAEDSYGLRLPTSTATDLIKQAQHRTQ